VGLLASASYRYQERRFLPHHIALFTRPILGVNHLKSDVAALCVVKTVGISRGFGGSGNRWPPGVDKFLIGTAVFTRFSGGVGRVDSFNNPTPGSYNID